MAERMLKDGRQVPELPEAKILTVKTKCPAKWLLIDLEPGEKHTGRNTDGKFDWKKLDA